MTKPSDSYRILHTADWHLGKTLEGQSREEEHDLFLAWLLDRVSELEVDAVIVAGDVFDNGMPPQTAIHRYFEFISRLRDRGGCKLVVIGGNHDSANQLEAPVPVLEFLGARVDGRVKVEPAERILLLPDSENPRVAVALIPFLRDSDVRKGRAGESPDEIRKSLAEGIKKKYDESAQVLDGLSCPALATGHLTVTGMRSSDSERTIIGGLGDVSHKVFPERFGYVALGHLHRPQSPDGDRVRYSGSPIPLSFSEAEDEKEVRVLDVTPEGIKDFPVPIPLSRNLVQLKVPYDELETRMAEFSPDASELTPWVEVVVEGAVFGDELSNRVRELAEGKGYEILKVIRLRSEGEEAGAMLADGEDYEFILDHPDQVFERLLDQREVTDGGERERLKVLFDQIVSLAGQEEANGP
jgi:DNA repair protein SbcD/Mre11